MPSYDVVSGYKRDVRDVNLDDVNRVLHGMREQAYSALGISSLYPQDDVEENVWADIRYVGQTSALTVHVGSYPLTARELLELPSRFHEAYLRRYGRS